MKRYTYFDSGEEVLVNLPDLDPANGNSYRELINTLIKKELLPAAREYTCEVLEGNPEKLDRYEALDRNCIMGVFNHPLPGWINFIDLGRQKGRYILTLTPF